MLAQRLKIVHTIVSVIMLTAILGLSLIPKNSAEDDVLLPIMWVLFAYVSVYIPKLLIVICELLVIIIRKPCRLLRAIFLLIGAIAFLMMWWGALVNRFRVEIVPVEVKISNLPNSFEGYRIVQLSDLHCGTYGNDTSFLCKVVEQVNDLQPDVIVFTGDIVNRHSPELKPFLSTLSRLRAKVGVYSITGNHDYGTYYRFASKELQDADFAALCEMEESMGWKMLNNDFAELTSGGDTIYLIGMENVGGSFYQVRNVLEGAGIDFGDNRVKILLSHDPSLWKNTVKDNDKMNIALTLSGHTHAMQTRLFGISPSSLVYENWAGLYSDGKGQQLYVNIGIGTVGMPMRVGATPEITLFTLSAR